MIGNSTHTISSPSVCFKRWRNKNWSVFSSFGKIIKISVLSIAYFAGINSVKVAAQTETDSISHEKEVEMEEVVVTAQRTEVGFDEVARIVTIVSRNEIEAAPVQSIHDLLKYTQNVDIRQRGKFGAQADISIRGGTFDQTMILLNGVNITDPQTGHHNLNLPVNIESIERIEVLHGPGARVFGPNAFSGAVNFITGISNKNRFLANISGGQYGFFSGSVASTFLLGDLKNHLVVGHKQSDGYIENTDFKKTHVFYHGQLPVGKSKFNFQFGHSQNGFGANSFYTPVFPQQYEKLKTTFASIALKTGNKVKFKPVIYWRRNQDRFELFRNSENAPDWYQSHNYHLTDVLGVDLNASFKWKLGTTALGTTFRNEKIYSNVLGKGLYAPKKVPGEEADFTKKDDRTNISYFMEHTFRFGKLNVSAGILANWNSSLDQNISIYPGADVSYSVTKKLKWVGSINKSLRLPTFTDLYYNGPTNVGNPHLKPEEAVTLESGFKWNEKGMFAHVSSFKRFGKNMIDWIRKAETEKWQSQNLTDVDSWGIETGFKLYPQIVLKNDFPVKRAGLSYSFTELSKTSGDFLSFYVLDNLKHKFDFDADIRLYKDLFLNFHVAWQDRNGTFALYDKVSKAYTGEKAYAPFWMFDGKLYWEKQNYTLFIEASNLFDEQFFDIGNVEQPGRWVRGGVAFRLDL